MPDLDAARAAVQQAAKPVTPPGPGGKSVSAIEARFMELERELSKRTSNRARDIQSAITLIGTSASRRSRGARKLSADLCELMSEDASADALRLALSMEDALQNADGEALMSALAAASEMNVGGRAQALVLAQASNALRFLAEHFPGALEEVENPFEQAFALAEEAFTLAPGLAEAHSALSFLVMMHGDPQALRDAERLTISGLKAEPEHDGCTLALASIRLIQGDYAHALELCGELAARGYARGVAHLVAARAQRGLGNAAEAQQAIDRGLKLAPDLVALHLEGCLVARMREDDAAFDAHHDRVTELLGSPEDADEAIAFASGESSG